MTAIKIKIDDARTDCDVNVSHFFGGVMMPESWLKGGVFSPTDLFLCVIDLSQLKKAVGASQIKDSGFLYFFVDTESSPAACKALYAESPDSYVEFNYDAETEFDVETARPIRFEKGESGSAMFIRDEKVYDGETCLLRFDTAEFKEIDFLSDLDGYLYFIIDNKSLDRGEYNKTKLYFVDKKGE